MLSQAKQTAVRAATRWPLYRLTPFRPLRTYAAVKYLAEHADRAAVADYLRTRGGVPDRPLAAALVAARAAFRVGEDDVLADALARLAARHPQSAPVTLLHADLETFRGAYESALALAQQALARGASAEAAARVVTLSYRVRPGDEADTAAQEAVARFPRSPRVWWPAATGCAHPEQYHRLVATWRDRAPAADADLLPVVRQLAVAASRAGELSEATGWYAAAAEYLLDDPRRRVPRPPVTTLAGLGARNAITDLCSVLDRAGVPFFFAAGTALGLVRAGRPLGADGDIDVGVFDAHWDRDALVALFRDDPRFDLDLHPQTSKVGLRHRGGSPVDIFRFYREGERVWHDGVFVRWHNSPFEVTRQPVGAQQLPLPADPEQYLTENYGPDWRTPWPGFDAFTDDAPNLEVTWPEYQAVHFARRGWQALAAGDRAGAAVELRRAGLDALARRCAPQQQ